MPTTTASTWLDAFGRITYTVFRTWQVAPMWLVDGTINDFSTDMLFLLLAVIMHAQAQYISAEQIYDRFLAYPLPWPAAETPPDLRAPCPFWRAVEVRRSSPSLVGDETRLGFLFYFHHRRGVGKGSVSATSQVAAYIRDCITMQVGFTLLDASSTLLDIWVFFKARPISESRGRVVDFYAQNVKSAPCLPGWTPPPWIPVHQSPSNDSDYLELTTNDILHYESWHSEGYGYLRISHADMVNIKYVLINEHDIHFDETPLRSTAYVHFLSVSNGQIFNNIQYKAHLYFCLPKRQIEAFYVLSVQEHSSLWRIDQ